MLLPFYVFGVYGCSDDNSGDEQIQKFTLAEVDLQQNFTKEKGELSIPVSTTLDASRWDVASNQDWCTGGVFVVSNLLDGDLVMDKPFFSVDQKSSVELTKLAEAGNVDPLKSLVADQTGIITTLHGAIVVVYTGNTNPIYQLGQKDAQLGLSALAQRGDPAQLKASLEKVPQVRKIYTLTDTVLPGKSMECTYEAAANEKVAFATMFGYSNDWFFANGPELNALTKGEVTSKTVLLDDGTAVSQYPGAGNAQFVFGGTRMPEDKAISAVGDTFPVPAVDGIVKITIY